MIRSLARVLAGFALACLTAGLIQVLFARPPGALLGSPASVFAGRASELGVLVLLAATHAAIFAAAFGLIAAGIGEWTGTRTMAYYLFTGAVIAMLGFTAQYSSEAPGQATVLNNYALKAFLTSGFFAGLVYWLVAGRKAGGADGAEERDGAGTDENTIGVPPPARTWKNRPRLIIEDAPKPGTKDSKKASLAERLGETEGSSGRIAKVDAPAAPEKVDRSPPAASQPQPAKPAELPAAKPSPATSVPATKPAPPAKSDENQRFAPDSPPKDTAGSEPKKN